MKRRADFLSDQAPLQHTFTKSVKRVGILGNLHKERIAKVCREIISYARRKNVAVTLADEMIRHLELGENEADDFRAPLADCDLIVTLGGDGTILYNTRKYYPLKMPVLAVNMGDLGFNTQATPEQLPETFDAILAGAALLQERVLLEMTLLRNDRPILTTHAANDIVLTKTLESRVVHFEVAIAGEFACHYRGDGLVIATPTGSTAYNLALGGPVIHPARPCFAIAPMCSMRNGTQPLVIPSTLPLEINWQVVKDREAVRIGADGQEWHDLQEGDRVQLCAAKHPLRLIVRSKQNYFGILHDKIGWGGALPS